MEAVAVADEVLVRVTELAALREAVREAVRDGVGSTHVAATISRLYTPGQGSPKSSLEAETLQEALPRQACVTTCCESNEWQPSHTVRNDPSQESRSKGGCRRRGAGPPGPYFCHTRMSLGRP